MSSSHLPRGQRSNINNRSVQVPADPARITRKEVPAKPILSEEEFNRLIITLEEEKDRCDDLSNKYVETYNELQRVIKALGSIHTSDTFFHDDNKITNLVADLRYDIKQWSHQNFPTCPPFKKNLSSYIFPAGNPFEKVVENTKSYMSSDQDGDLPALIQGYIWHRLTDQVFDNGLWVAGPECLKRNSTISKKKPEACEKRDPEPYHQWRSLTARLVPPQAHGACTKAGVTKLVDDIRSEIKSFASTDNKRIFYESEDKEPHSHDIALETIIISAISLDRIMWQQRASFRFGVLDNGKLPKKFNPEIMESGLEDERGGTSGKFVYTPSSSDGYVVQLMRAPHLEKYGTQEGGDYGTRVVLLKAVVDLMQPTLYPRSSLPSHLSISRTGSTNTGRSTGKFF